MRDHVLYLSGPDINTDSSLIQWLEEGIMLISAQVLPSRLMNIYIQPWTCVGDVWRVVLEAAHIPDVLQPRVIMFEFIFKPHACVKLNR